MINWRGIPDNVKLVCYLVGAFAAALLWLYTNFETVSASDQRWDAHNQAIACKTVADLRAQAREIETRLQFDTSLTTEGRTFLQNQLRQIQAEIDRIDPNRMC